MTSHSNTVRMAMAIQTYRNRLHLIPTYYKNKHADRYIHTYKHVLILQKTTWRHAPTNLPSLHTFLIHTYLGSCSIRISTFREYRLSLCSVLHTYIHTISAGVVPATSRWVVIPIEKHIDTYIHTYVDAKANLNIVKHPSKWIVNMHCCGMHCCGMHCCGIILYMT